MRPLLCWMLTLLACSSGVAAQGHQYYEQFRTSRQVTGSCEGIIEFSNQLRQALIGDWEHRDVFQFSSPGYTTFSFPTGGKEEKRYGVEACQIKAKRTATISFGSPDAFGGVGGLAAFTADMSPVPPPTVIGLKMTQTCHAYSYRGIPAGRYDFSLALPIEESYGQCTLATPRIRLTNDATSFEHKLYLIDANTFGVTTNAGDMLFKRKRQPAQ